MTSSEKDKATLKDLKLTVLRYSLWSLFFFALVVNIHRHGGGIKLSFDFLGIFYLFTSYFSVLLLVFSLETLAGSKLRRTLMPIFAFFFGMLFYFSKRTAFPLTYSIIVENVGWIASNGGVDLIRDLAHSTYFASDVFWSMLLSVLVYSTYPRKSVETPLLKRFWPVSLAITLVLLTSFVQPYSYDPVTNFLRSVKYYYLPQKNILSNLAEKQSSLPPVEVQSQFDSGTPPHIFLLIVESFNSRFVNKKSESGIEFTPFVNSLTKNNLYFPNYFSNSIHTSKGHFAAICNQVPLLRGVEFAKPQCFQKRCLPELMQEEGYKTIAIQADPNFDVENEKTFLLNHGVEDFAEVVRLCHEDTDRCYGIGIRDDVFYRRALDYLDPIDASIGPNLVIISPVASHMPFNFQPPEEREIYKDPKNKKEDYLNTLRMVDNSLKYFVERFQKSQWAKNSVLIITGDHGFPTGEHGSSHNENFAYSENFGVPLLILDSRQDLKSRYSHIEEFAFSHLNLGPTIVDLAGINKQTDFIASSLFSEKSHSEPIYLVQPHSGGYQATLRWPFKYIFEQHSQKEQLFNLKSDPGETKPLDLAKHDAITQLLRTDAAQMYIQQSDFDCKGSSLKSVSPSLLNVSKKFVGKHRRKFASEQESHK